VNWKAPSPTSHVAVIEDDHSIGRSMSDALAAHGYRVDWHQTGAALTTSLESEVPDLVLLDAGLPDVDGFSLCRWLREQHRDLPILLVTARDSEIDIVVGLDAGADDYITKPFSTNVLLARVRAHLRGASVADANAAIELGRLRIQPGSYTAEIDGSPIQLRRREFELLVYLARHAGQALTRETLLSEVWDLHWDSSTKTVDMHIVALRRRLGDAAEIVTIRGVGYRLVVE
jgi:DNA-binding response OmpR family regulator